MEGLSSDARHVGAFKPERVDLAILLATIASEASVIFNALEYGEDKRCAADMLSAVESIAQRHGLWLERRSVPIQRLSARELYEALDNAGALLGSESKRLVEAMGQYADFKNVVAAHKAFGDYMDFLRIRGALATMLEHHKIAQVKSKYGYPPMVVGWVSTGTMMLHHLLEELGAIT